MVVQAAVGDEEDVVARDFAVDHASDIDAGFADDVAAELEHDASVAQGLFQARHEALQVGADHRKVEWAIAREVGNAEPAADIQRRHRTRGVGG